MPHSLFRGTATFYAQFRPGIPAPVAELIAREAGADGTGGLLDVGTGTGQVLRALADEFELGVGIEPDPSMLAEARRAVDEVGLADRVVLERGRAPDPPRDYAPYADGAARVDEIRALAPVDEAVPALVAIFEAHETSTLHG